MAMESITTSITFYYINISSFVFFIFAFLYSLFSSWGHGGAVVTQLHPTSEVGGSNAERYMGNIVVSYRWSAVYSTEP